MPSVFFIGMVAVQGSFLNAHNVFFAPSFGPVLNNMLVIASIFLLAPLFGMTGVAWGTTAGFAIFALYLAVPLLRRGYNFRLKLRVLPEDKDLRKMGERFIPVMIGAGVTQLYQFIEKILAGGLGDARITALSYAYTIAQLPVAIFVGAMAMPIFPLMSEYVKKKQMSDMKKLLGKGLLYQYHLLLPTSVGLIVLSDSFVQAFYGHGDKVTQEDIHLIAWALIFYAVGLLGWSGRDLLSRASYAIENTKVPVYTGFVAVMISFGLAYVFMPFFDHGGLALAFSVGIYANVLLQIWLLRRQIGKLFDRSFFVSILRGFIAALVMLVILLSFQRLLGDLLGIFLLLVMIIIAAAGYIGMLFFMKEPLLRELTTTLFKRKGMKGGHAGGK